MLPNVPPRDMQYIAVLSSCEAFWGDWNTLLGNRRLFPWTQGLNEAIFLQDLHWLCRWRQILKVWWALKEQHSNEKQMLDMLEIWTHLQTSLSQESEVELLKTSFHGLSKASIYSANPLWLIRLRLHLQTHQRLIWCFLWALPFPSSASI